MPSAVVEGVKLPALAIFGTRELSIADGERKAVRAVEIEIWRVGAVGTGTVECAIGRPCHHRKRQCIALRVGPGQLAVFVAAVSGAIAS